MGPTDLLRPYVGMCFDVTAGGLPLGSFTECSGLAVDITTEDYKEGGNNHFVHKLPTHVATTPVVLKQGLCASKLLWSWIKSFVERSVVVPKVVQVHLMRPGPIPVPLRTWTLDHAYPIKWDGPQLNASKGEVVFESLELAHRGLTTGPL